MPEQETIKRAEEDKREGKSPSTQAGEFVREEMHHIREGKHGAANTKQAVAIGLSKARRSGVPLGTPKTGSKSTRTKASKTRARATRTALKRQPRRAASTRALSRQARTAAKRRPRSQRQASAR